jgi:hypothetical protein
MPDLQPSQASLRHIRLTAYRCFLPDLTGFTGRIAQDQRSAADQTRRVLMPRHDYNTVLRAVLHQFELKQADNLAVFVDVDRFSGRLARQAGHGHDVTRQGDDETGSGADAQFADRDRKAGRPAQQGGIIG